MYARSAATISAILAAAQRLFLDQNYADVTMGDIAEAAQVTKGALYHHFASKEALYLAMMHADLEEKRALIGQAVDSPGTCGERLRRLTLNFLELPPATRDLIRLVRRDINIFRDPLRAELVRAYQAALPEQVEQIVRDGLRSGELAPADARLLAWEFVAMVEVVLSRYAGQVLKNHEQMAEFVMGLFYNGATGRET
mgnify:CR=1 FL=1